MSNYNTNDLGFFYPRNTLINEGWYLGVLNSDSVGNIIIVLLISDDKALTSDQHSQ